MRGVCPKASSPYALHCRMLNLEALTLLPKLQYVHGQQCSHSGANEVPSLQKQRLHSNTCIVVPCRLRHTQSLTGQIGEVRHEALAWLSAPAAKGKGQAMAMPCASVRENSKQCLMRLSAVLSVLGVWNRCKASANASAKRMQDSIGLYYHLACISFIGVQRC